MKREVIQIRCSVYEKKLLKKRAARAGISQLEYIDGKMVFHFIRSIIELKEF